MKCLKIHIVVHGDQVALIFHAPFQLNDNGLAGELLEEGLRVQWGETLEKRR